jgi:hypothetical protein
MRTDWIFLPLLMTLGFVLISFTEMYWHLGLVITIVMIAVLSYFLYKIRKAYNKGVLK